VLSEVEDDDARRLGADRQRAGMMQVLYIRHVNLVDKRNLA